MTNLPPIAPYPPSDIRSTVPPTEWDACLEAWIAISELYLRSPLRDFQSHVRIDQSLEIFVSTYYQSVSDEHGKPSQASASTHNLHKSCFLLTHRILLDTKTPSARLLSWEFLGNFSRAHARGQSLEALLARLWEARRTELETSLHTIKASLIKRLDASLPDGVERDLQQLASLVHASPDTGAYLMAGSDFLDSLSTAYRTGHPSPRQKSVVLTYLGLVSLLKGEKPNHSMLFDHLYSLKSQAGKPGASASLLSDLVTNTPLVAKLNTSISGKDEERARKLGAVLAPYRSQSLARARRPTRSKPARGKGVASDAFGHGAFSGEQHVHRMSLVTQVQDLFPDLGSGFISRLLDEYHESVEQVTAHLLDDSLPPRLASLDRTLQLPAAKATDKDREQHDIDQLAPRSTPPPQTLPQRRNVFDNDEFDRLEVDPSRLHTGRRNVNKTAETVLADRSVNSKSAILSALAAFDSDDDERDDTYDEADVGGTVDNARPDGEPEEKPAIETDENSPNEEAMFRAWKLDVATFGRSADARRSPARQALKSETGMADEAIEGWGVMLARDPRRIRRLEARFSAFDGRQQMIGRTAFRDGGEETDSDGGHRGGFGGRGRGRGRGRGGGRGASVAGPANESGTQAARQRKGAGKGSRANHNRRDQRARKMARGGFPAA